MTSRTRPRPAGAWPTRWQTSRTQAEAWAGIQEARAAGDAEEAYLLFGQDAGLVNDLPPAGVVIRRIAADAEEILARKLPGLVK